MKTPRAIALVIAATGLLAYQGRQLPVFASARPLQSDAGTKTNSMDAPSAAGAKVFQSNCAMCHGENLLGHPPTFPSLAGQGKNMNAQQITELVRHGRGMMPAFASSKLSDADLASLLQYLAHDPTFTPPSATSSTVAAPAMVPAAAAASASDPGSAIFQQNCAFCHGRDAGGGESGPDLTRSKLVAADVNGSTIAPVVRNGRADNKMPKFNLSDTEMADLLRWIHATAKAAANAKPGGRKGVDVADLQTGNVDAGKAYFNGAGGCSSCHSATGDLAGIASRYEGLQLEERMLYPKDAKDTLTVTLPSGETVTGKVEYQDEFTVALRDANGVYRAWPVKGLKYKIDSPVSAHVDLFPKYSDDDIHNLMAYIQTMK